MTTENRIDTLLNNLRENKKKALIAFITSGDPDLPATYDFVLSLEQAGVDIIELGVPFSDPVAEGPVIQRASERALGAGFKIDNLFDMVIKLRSATNMPLLFMMYMNCIYAYGKERFFEKCRESGIDGLIVPDLPYEEQWELTELTEKYNIRSIYLLAPTSQSRIKSIAGNAKGFLYCVSSSGVTGTRDTFVTDFASFSEEIKKHAKVPACVGFGISNKDQAKELSQYFDGVIIGSAFVKIIEQHGKDAAPYLKEFAAQIRGGLA